MKKNKKKLIIYLKFLILKKFQQKLLLLILKLEKYINLIENSLAFFSSFLFSFDFVILNFFPEINEKENTNVDCFYFLFVSFISVYLIAKIVLIHNDTEGKSYRNCFRCCIIDKNN